MKIRRASIDGVEQPNPDGEELVPAQGNGAYEAFRVHDGKVFLFDEHFERLKKSLGALAIDWDDERQKYSAWIAELCGNLPADEDAFVRFVVTGRGSEPVTTVQASYIRHFAPRSYKAVVLDQTKLDDPEYYREVGFRVKSVNYIGERTDKQRSAGLDTATEGILLTPEGYIAESLSANIFWVKDGKLYTPPLSTGILAGTMRAYIMKNNQVEEILAPKEALDEADEIILTSGASYLRPLGRINDIEKPGAEGPVFKKLYEKLTEDIEKNSKHL
ncbi:MAG TPA: aminotransferase class IV [Candidatus Saccharimonadales bacterium]|nr:aminotransferase class IV [Candidatus Saccharimonadales bacterium]